MTSCSWSTSLDPKLLTRLADAVAGLASDEPAPLPPIPAPSGSAPADSSGQGSSKRRKRSARMCDSPPDGDRRAV